MYYKIILIKIASVTVNTLFNMFMILNNSPHCYKVNVLIRFKRNLNESSMFKLNLTKHVHFVYVRDCIDIQILF